MYDFVHHCRASQVQQVQPAEVILFEGILVLHIAEIVKRLNLKV
jgi:uridine kinase